MKPFLFICLGLLFTRTLAAQTISGLIRDSETKHPLANAAIIQTGTTNGTVSDLNGKFAISLLPENSRFLSISFLGYQSKQIELAFSKRFYSIELVPDDVLTSEVLVESYRVGGDAPIAHTNLEAEALDKTNFGQDIPVLLGQTPSIVTTSDAGGGVGYTGLRIRGVDPGRINVTLNGIPWNDAESHNVYWVDLPDLISSAGNIQIQRGVGTSTNGPAAFGATIDLQTTRYLPDPYTDFSISYGSFNTRRMNLKFGTGLLPSGWTLNSSFSGISSDGYIDRATSDLKSAYLSLAHPSENSLLTFNLILGREETYQAWNGVPEAVIKGDKKGKLDYAARNYLSPKETDDLLKSGRTYNYYTYDNQVDHYGQDHYQILYNWTPAKNISLDFAGFYVKGKGYYEQFKPDDNFASYGLPPVITGSDTLKKTDLIRRKWLDNDYYGVLSSGTIDFSPEFSLVTGGGVSVYDGDHFGEIIWARNASTSNIRDRYYEDNAKKLDGNLFTKLNIQPITNLLTYLDFQFRTISYRFLGLTETGKQEYMTRDFLFFNPKAGISWKVDNSSLLYFGFGAAGKEPTRSEFTDVRVSQQPKKETLYNIETGYRFSSLTTKASINFYGMFYHNQLVLTGKLNDVGDPLRQNVTSSSRMGVELEGAVQLPWNVNWSGNLTLGTSSIKSFKEILIDYETYEEVVRVHKNKPISFSPSVISGSKLSWQTGDFSADWQSKYVSEQFLDNTGNSSRKLDAYLINDLYFSWETEVLSSYQRVRLQAGILNLFDVLYEPNGYSYSYLYAGDLTTENFYYPQAGRNYMIKLQFML